MAPPEPGPHRPLMAPSPGDHHVWRGTHVELRGLLWTYAAVLALVVIGLQTA